MRPLGEIWIYVADSLCRDYSPLYDQICRAVADSDAVLDLVAEAPDHGHNPLLLLAAAHDLLLSGVDHPLAGVYAGCSNMAPGPLFIDFCLQWPEELIERISSRQVNTNEVGRSALLGPAFTTIAGRFGAPIGHLDVGCSAGLNLLADRYRLDYGPAGATGPSESAVRVDCAVTGGVPPVTASLPPVAARVGLDRAPVNLADDEQVRWQLACVWPDTGRLSRTRAALEVARSTPLTLIEGDAVAAVGTALSALPARATAVVTTTFVMAYLSHEQRSEFRAALLDESRSRPIAWVSADAAGVVDDIPADQPPDDADGVEACVLGLVTFEGGHAQAELLAYVHPHGRTIDWRAALPA